MPLLGALVAAAAPELNIFSIMRPCAPQPRTPTLHCRISLPEMPLECA